MSLTENWRRSSSIGLNLIIARDRMKPLTKTELSEIDRAIDATVPSQPLLSRGRDVGLIHALRYFDAYTTTCGSIPEPGQREIASWNSLSALDHMVRWIFRFCEPHSGRPNLKIDADVYQEAKELHALAGQYAKIWVIMSHLFRGTLVGFSDEPGIIRVSYSSQLNVIRRTIQTHRTLILEAWHEHCG